MKIDIDTASMLEVLNGLRSLLGLDDTRLAESLNLRDLLTFEVSPSVSAPLEPRQMHVQRLQQAVGALSLDKYEIRITKMPQLEGKPLTAESLCRTIRLGMGADSPLTHNDFFSEFRPYEAQDNLLWNADNPVGAVIYIDIPGPNDASVLCSDASSTSWRFSTISTPRSHAHPVSGHRDFSIRRDGDNFVFSARGSDRVTDYLESALHIGLRNVAFEGAAQLWVSMQKSLIEFVEDNGGKAEVVEPEVLLFNWETVAEFQHLSLKN
jgi:hypothetical protein